MIKKCIYLITLIPFAILSLTLVVPSEAKASRGPEVRYLVSIEKDTDIAHVQIHISSIQSNPLILRIGYEALTQGATEYFSNIKASTNDQALSVVANGDGVWQVSVSGNTVVIDYDIQKIVPFTWQHPYADGSEVAVYIDNDVGYIMAPFFFLYPDITSSDLESVQLKFEVPEEWQVFTPYIDEGEYYTAQKVTNSLLSDFINRQQIYMGKMKFTGEENIDGCVVQLGVSESDINHWTQHYLATQYDVDAFVRATAQSLEAISAIFGENPYHVYTMYTNFSKKVNGKLYSFPGTRYFGNGYQHWPEHRWDELVSHMMLSFVEGHGKAPLTVDYVIEKGIAEGYLGQKLAWELYRDPAYLAKTYYYYLLYERMLVADNTQWGEFNGYVKGTFVGLLLDEEMQRVTNGGSSLSDVLHILYQTHKNSGHIVSLNDIEVTMESLTGYSFSDIFAKYVYGNEKLPVYGYIETYKDYFLEYPELFSDLFNLPVWSHTSPLFILLEMTTHVSPHVPAGIYNPEYINDFALHMLNHYELETISENDVEAALTTLTGVSSTGFFKHWQNSFGNLSLDDLKGWLNEYEAHLHPSSKSETGTEQPSESYYSTDTATSISISETITESDSNYAQESSPKTIGWQTVTVLVVGAAIVGVYFRFLYKKKW